VSTEVRNKKWYKAARKKNIKKHASESQKKAVMDIDFISSRPAFPEIINFIPV